MSFLAPAFLAAMAAVSIPLLLHLLQRERKEPVVFPSLMFLQRIPHQAVRRQRLKHLLLLALRCLALVLLALAFARPFLRGRVPLPGVGGRDGREVVLLLDRSASMAHGERWARAVAEARRVVEGLDGGDRLTLVLFDASASVVADATGDRDVLRAALDAARPGAGATRYAPALRVAQQRLAESDRPRREAVLVTDFQRIAWEGAGDVRFPAGATLTRVDVSSPDDVRPALLTVSPVELRRESGGAEERVSATVRVANRGGAPAANVPVSLVLNGRTLQTVRVTVPAGGVATAAFTPFALPPGFARGVVAVPRDALPVDDTARFVVARGQVRSALVVAEGGSPYFARALRLGAEPPWRVEVRAPDRLRPQDLAGRALVVLDGVPLPGGEVGRRLRQLVLDGGGLVMAVGADGVGDRALADELLPAVAGPVERDAGTTLLVADRTHPVLAPFGAGSVDLAAARAWRHWTLRADEGDRVLARFDDGAPALVERALGRGRVLVLAAPLDNRWSDLPVQPAFVPLVHQLARHASGWGGETPALAAGSNVDVERWAAAVAGASGARTLDAADVEWLVTDPAGRRAELAGPVGTSLAVREAGFYEVRRVEGRDERRFPLAVNVDPAETDLSRVDPAAVTVATQPAPDAAAVAAALGPEQLEARQRLWWWILALVLVVVAGETLLGNRLSRAG